MSRPRSPSFIRLNKDRESDSGSEYEDDRVRDSGILEVEVPEDRKRPEPGDPDSYKKGTNHPVLTVILLGTLETEILAISNEKTHHFHNVKTSFRAKCIFVIHLPLAGATEVAPMKTSSRGNIKRKSSRKACVKTSKWRGETLVKLIFVKRLLVF